MGALIGTWAMSGTRVAMVHHALGILSPNDFYVSTVVICALVAFSTGTSWTTVGTIGVALMGVAAQMGLSPAVTAGAVISGAHFGDKSSPLSDTANLAAAATGPPLYDDIRASLVTGVPALVVAAVVFWTMGRPGDFDASGIQTAIGARFDVSTWAFLPVAVVVVLSMLRTPPFLAILGGALAGGVTAVVLQPGFVLHLAGAEALPAWLGMIKGVWYALATAFALELANSGETYAPGSRDHQKDLVIGALATFYTLFMLWTGGLKYVLLAAVLLAPGTILFILARREARRNVFTPVEWALFAVVLLGAVYGVYGLVTGDIQI